MLLTWDKESIIKNPDRPKISDTYHSDICDAVLYAWRECRHYLSEAIKPKSRIGTDTYMDELEAQEAEDMKNKMENPQDYELEKSWEDDLDELDAIINMYEL